jgi:hypothetical protein
MVLAFGGDSFAASPVERRVVRRVVRHSVRRAPDQGHRHPAAGTSIVRFAQVDAGIYRGSTPRSDADFEFLRSKHIRYVMNLEFLPLISEIEEHKAKKYGMAFIPALMNGSPVAPSEKHVTNILRILRDRRVRPIYFHCSLGRDRTSLIAALYKMYFKGMSQQAAWREMKAFGFKDSWTLRGLKKYFEEHPRPPASLASPGHATPRRRTRR